MLANLLIGLREGLEAALIIGILVAYLAKIGRKKSIPQVTLGVAVAVALSAGLGLLLNLTVENVEAGLNQTIGGVASILAVVFVTWMVFWMKSQSVAIGADLRSQLDSKSTAAFGVSIIAFIAVIREGIETSIFLWSAGKATATGDNPVVGAVIGLVVAALLGILIYRGALKINLSKFFTVTATFLIVVAAGILAYAVSEFEEIIDLPLQATAYDLTGLLPEGSTFEALLHGLFSFNPAPTMLQSAVWLSYFVPTAYLYLRKNKTSK